ncbi:mitochondrial enolase superfamily member 1-like [Pogonomyrmex barbatus]|uniref:Mitochondrial enolase superfamily member 1-like n=1 Tax=Pogonomyrmex barbatus TaxID=144034 RepID=A0A6I9WKS7_9HYME|nr:mitochondrial enolase superfamily member 1-like [Pogonomyrmex barbatus]
MINAEITDIEVHNVSFPTSTRAFGSDSMHGKPNHACTYVIIHTNTQFKGYGITATLGRGNEFVVLACKLMFEDHVKGQTTTEIYSDFASFWRKLTNDVQYRWIGPECGVVHLATAAIVNALWDLWARIEDKPLWKLLTDMSPEQLVSTMEFKYIRDVITEEEAIKILKEQLPYKEQYEKHLLTKGYPAYTADIGWWNYSNQQMRSASKKFQKLRFKEYKTFVGNTISESCQRCILLRHVLGKKKKIIIDASQFWDQDEVEHVAKRLAHYRIFGIEDPSSPDDFLAYTEMRDELNYRLIYKVEVTCGEICANRVQFKQFLKNAAINYWNLNVGRLGGVNEALVVCLMAKKHNIPVWGHAGGIGLGEMNQHLQIWSFICLGNHNAKMEYVSHQHGYFENPVHVSNFHFVLPKRAGFSTKLKDKCIVRWSYPEGSRWKDLFKTV